jgi:hypothetical protein
MFVLRIKVRLHELFALANCVRLSRCSVAVYFSVLELKQGWIWPLDPNRQIAELLLQMQVCSMRMVVQLASHAYIVLLYPCCVHLYPNACPHLKH